MDGEEHMRAEKEWIPLIDFVSICLSTRESTDLSSPVPTSIRGEDNLVNQGQEEIIPTLFGICIASEIDIKCISHFSNFIQSHASCSPTLTPSASSDSNGINHLTSFISDQTDTSLPHEPSPSLPHSTNSIAHSLSDTFLNSPIKLSPLYQSLPCPSESELPSPSQPCFSSSPNQFLPILSDSPSWPSLSTPSDSLYPSASSSLKAPGSISPQGLTPPQPSPTDSRRSDSLLLSPSQSTPHTDHITKNELQAREILTATLEAKREVTPTKRNQGTRKGTKNIVGDCSFVDLSLELHPSPSDFYIDLQGDASSASNLSKEKASRHSGRHSHLVDRTREKDVASNHAATSCSSVDSDIEIILHKKGNEQMAQDYIESYKYVKEEELLQKSMTTLTVCDILDVSDSEDDNVSNFDKDVICIGPSEESKKHALVHISHSQPGPTNNTTHKAAASKEQAQKLGNNKGTDDNLSGKQQNKVKRKRNRSKRKAGNVQDLQVPFPAKEDKVVEQVEGEVKLKDGEPVKSYMVPFISDDPQENKDNEPGPTNNTTHKAAASKEQAQKLGNNKGTDDNLSGKQQNKVKRKRNRSKRKAGNVQDLQVPFPAKEDKVVEQVEGEVKLKDGEPVKSYMVPFISDDPQENKDNEDPGWSYLRLLKTDAERYQQSRTLWKSVVVPDPNVNLTNYGYLRCKRTNSSTRHHDTHQDEGRESNVTGVQESYKRKREETCGSERERDGYGQPPRKRLRFNDVGFSVRKFQKCMKDVSSDYVEDLNSRLMSRNEALRMERIYKEKMHQLDMAISEVKTFHNFYNGLPDQEQSITQDQVESDEVEVEQLYSCFRDVYGWNGQAFYP